LSGSVDATVRGEPEAWASTDAQVVIVASGASIRTVRRALLLRSDFAPRACGKHQYV
jgi:hypothetical protein